MKRLIENLRNAAIRDTQPILDKLGFLPFISLVYWIPESSTTANVIMLTDKVIDVHLCPTTEKHVIDDAPDHRLNVTLSLIGTTSHKQPRYMPPKDAINVLSGKVPPVPYMSTLEHNLHNNPHIPGTDDHRLWLDVVSTVHESLGIPTDALVTGWPYTVAVVLQSNVYNYYRDHQGHINVKWQGYRPHPDHRPILPVTGRSTHRHDTKHLHHYTLTDLIDLVKEYTNQVNPEASQGIPIYYGTEHLGYLVASTHHLAVPSRLHGSIDLIAPLIDKIRTKVPYSHQQVVEALTEAVRTSTSPDVSSQADTFLKMLVPGTTLILSGYVDKYSGDGTRQVDYHLQTTGDSIEVTLYTGTMMQSSQLNEYHIPLVDVCTIHTMSTDPLT